MNLSLKRFSFQAMGSYEVTQPSTALVSYNRISLGFDYTF